jgi:transcriptional regulator with XRE-family HTH domain
VGDVLRQRRKALHLSQAVIARELGMTKTTICRLEQGQRRSYLDRALPYAHLLDVPYARLFPPRCASPLDRLIQRILAAPPYVHTLFDSILDIPQYGTPAQHVDAS